MAKNRKKAKSFDIQEFLSADGKSRRIAKFKKGQVIFSQDDPCDDVLYIQSGNAKLSIVNPHGKEAVLGIVGPGDFLGEGCIIGNPLRMATATAMAPPWEGSVLDIAQSMLAVRPSPERVVTPWMIAAKAQSIFGKFLAKWILMTIPPMKEK